MGLTVSYSIRSTIENATEAEELVRQMRQLAFDLPFEAVGDVISLEGDECDAERQRDALAATKFWLAVQGCNYITSPWNKENYLCVTPNRLIAFDIKPGPGSEPANLGLCTYPSEIQGEYRPDRDSRFAEEFQPYGPGSSDWQFSQSKWEQWLIEHGYDQHLKPDDERFVETRRIKTGLVGWRWQSFTKTQYASDPACGGIANFLRCHISVVTLLDRIGKLPTIEVELNDEGEYGPHRAAVDREEGQSDDSAPDFAWHKGHYDPKALVAEVEKWNGIVAVFAGVMKDAIGKAGMASFASIQSYPNFEQLEFRGSQDEKLQPFLKQMQEWAKRLLGEAENERDVNKGEGGEE